MNGATAGAEVVGSAAVPTGSPVGPASGAALVVVSRLIGVLVPIAASLVLVVGMLVVAVLVLAVVLLVEDDVLVVVAGGVVEVAPGLGSVRSRPDEWASGARRLPDAPWPVTATWSVAAM